MSAAGSARLASGDLAPLVRGPVPGPRSLALHRRLLDSEPPETAPVQGVVWREALGANVLDVDGNRFLDLTSGFGAAAVGHRHPKVVAAVERQVRRLLHGLADAQAHAVRVELSERLAALGPWPDGRVMYAVSGSDAVELAIKTAVLATGRSVLLAFEPSYHGLTLGALHATSRAAFREPFADHLVDRVVRLPFACSPAELRRALAHHRPAAVLFEPIVGREGALIPPDGWLDDLGRVARRHGALAVADEVFVGFGRAGTLFESVARMEEPPDLLCVGKALGGGMPIAAVLGPDRHLACWGDPGEARHTATFVAHPPACAAALAVLEVLAEDGLIDRAARLGEAWGLTLSERLAGFGAVRGRGLLWAVEMESRARARALVDRALEAGLLVLAGGPEGRLVQLAPPLSTAERLLELAVDLLVAAGRETRVG